MNQWKIPLFDSDINEIEIKEVTKVLESRWLTMGGITKQFEDRFFDLWSEEYRRFQLVPLSKDFAYEERQSQL